MRAFHFINYGGEQNEKTTDTITQLNTLLTAQTKLKRSQQRTVEDLRQDNKKPIEQIDYLTKKLFGTSNEKAKTSKVS